MDASQIKDIKCPACKREQVEIQRKDNPFSTCRVCINEDCPLHINLSKLKNWQIKEKTKICNPKPTRTKYDTFSESILKQDIQEDYSSGDIWKSITT